MNEASYDNIFVGFYLGLGDIFCAHQALVDFANHNHDHQVFIAVGSSAAPAVELFEWPDNVQFINFVLPRLGSFSGVRRFWFDFTSRRYARVISSPHSPLARASWKIPIFMKVVSLLGYAIATEGPSQDPLSFLYKKRWPISRKIPLPRRDQAFFKLLSQSVKSGEPEQGSSKIVLATDVHTLKRDAIGIHVGASLANRRWPPENTAELCWLIRNKFPDHQIDLFGLQHELDEILSLSIPSCTNVALGSLRDSVERVKSLQAIITMDSGFMHVASAFGIPQVAIFGPSSIKPIFPENPRAIAVHSDVLSCQPCDLAKCKFEKNYCMIMVTPAQVLSALVELTADFDG